MKTRDEVIAMITEIGTIEDAETRRARLAELQNDVTEVYTTTDNLNEVRQRSEDRIRQLESVNMDLFLQVGANKTEKEVKEDQTGLKEDDPPQKRKFEDLFDEKGGLK